MTPSRQALLFKITLRDVEPPIWRRIQVPDEATFWDLHVALQDAMGWTDTHLHAFWFEVEPGGELRLEIGIPSDEDENDFSSDLQAGWDIPLREHFTEPGVSCLYMYDFGDGWEHDLAFEGAEAVEDDAELPRCLGGERACPPEDCGGPHGYRELLEALADPDHEEHESFREWLGSEHDPEAFDPADVRFDDPRERFQRPFPFD